MSEIEKALTEHFEPKKAETPAPQPAAAPAQIPQQLPPQAQQMLNVLPPDLKDMTVQMLMGNVLKQLTDTFKSLEKKCAALEKEIVTIQATYRLVYMVAKKLDIPGLK